MQKDQLDHTDSGKVVTDIINFYLENFGKMVSEEQYKARLGVCKGCDQLGKVNVAGIIMDGCTNCGCPSATKPRVLKYWNPRKFKTVTVDCPLGKWAEVDQFYNNKI